MKRADKALRIGAQLDELYPETPVPLHHSSAYTLLVAVMLSAQTTDKKVNEVTPSECPSTVWSASPVAASQRRAVLSQLPVARTFPRVGGARQTSARQSLR